MHTKSRQKRATANEALGNSRDALNDRLAIILYSQLSGRQPDKAAEQEVEDLVKTIAKAMGRSTDTVSKHLFKNNTAKNNKKGPTCQ